MKALRYLVLTGFKNRLLSLKKKPAMLILYLFVFVCIALMIVGSIFLDKERANTNFIPKDVRYIYLIITGFGLLFISTFISTGLSTGSTLFTMPDVGLLFVSPVSSKKILVYGLIKELGKSLLGAFFILFQLMNLKTNFGFGLKEILSLFLIYALMVFFCQLFSIAIYVYTNGNTARKQKFKTVIIAIGACILFYAYYTQKQSDKGMLETVLQVVDSKWFGYIPIAGWSTMFLKAVIVGNTLNIIVSLGLYLVFSLLIVSYFMVGKADYYEDVLISTEVRHQTLTAAKEGRRVNPKFNKKIKIKEEDSGLLKGKGSLAITYKHILEMKRKSRFIFIDTYTVLTMVGTGIICYRVHKDFIGFTVLGILVYLQFFMTVLGRLGTEISKHYIYLIPEKSKSKVFAASITSFLKPCIDGFLIFAVMAVMKGADPLTCIFLALAYTFASAIFIALTILYQRLLGGQPNKLVQSFVGFGLFFLIMIPAITPSVIIGSMLPKKLLFLSLLPFIFVCALVTLLIFLTCGNLFDKSEYTGK